MLFLDYGNIYLYQWNIHQILSICDDQGRRVQNVIETQMLIKVEIYEPVGIPQDIHY